MQAAMYVRPTFDTTSAAGAYAIPQEQITNFV